MKNLNDIMNQKYIIKILDFVKFKFGAIQYAFFKSIEFYSDLLKFYRLFRVEKDLNML